MPDASAALRFLQGSNDTSNVQGPPAPVQIDLAPLSTSAVQSALPERPVTVERNTVQDEASRLGARRGVPFDESSGIPMLARLRMEMQRNKDDQFKVLQHMYGEENVRLNPKGEPVVTVRNAEGHPTDILANPEGPDPGDLMKLVANAPEIVVSALITKGLPVRPGILAALRSLGVMAASAEGAGAAKDIVARKAEGIEMQPKEVFKTRSGMAVGDFLFGSGLGLLSKSATKVITPFGGDYPELTFQAREARQSLIDRFNLSQDALPQSAAEATGNLILGRGESYARKIPGSSRSFTKFMAQRRDELDNIQRIIEGNTPPMPDEALGEKALSAIGGKVQTIESDVERARSGLKSTAQGEIESIAAGTTGMQGPISRTALGRVIRTGAEAKREAFENSKNKLYSEVYAHPGVSDKAIDPAPLATDAQALIRRLPSDSTEQLTPSIILDEFGNPATQTATEKSRTLTEFVPSNVVGKLHQLADLNSPKSLSELIAMRNEVSNDIAQGEAIKGYQTKYLSEIRSMLTDRIKGGLKEIDPSGAALAKWEKANSFYADNVKQFQRAGIAEIYRDPEQGSFIGDSALVQRALSGRGADDIYSAYKDFFGAQSPVIKGLHRAVADEVIGTHELNPTIDAKAFLNRLEGLFQDAPDLAKAVFGSNSKSIKASALALKGAEGNLDARELEQIALSGNLSKEKLADLMAAEAKRDDAYRNSILQKVSKGTIGPERIKPTEFVDRFAFKAEPSEVRQVIDKLQDQPELLEDIRLSTLSKVFSQARDAHGNLTGSGIAEALADSTKRDRLAAIVGDETVASLRDLSRFLAPSESLDTLFGSAGSFGATSKVSRLLEHGDLKYIKNYVKNMILGSVYMSPQIRRWASNTIVSNEDAARVVQSVVASEPFIRNLYALEGDKAEREARDIHDNLSAWALNLGVQQMKAPSPNGPSDAAIKQFLFDIGPQVMVPTAVQQQAKPEPPPMAGRNRFSITR